jgi:hypothetical protein
MSHLRDIQRLPESLKIYNYRLKLLIPVVDTCNINLDKFVSVKLKNASKDIM